MVLSGLVEERICVFLIVKPKSFLIGPSKQFYGLIQLVESFSKQRAIVLMATGLRLTDIVRPRLYMTLTSLCSLSAP